MSGEFSSPMTRGTAPTRVRKTIKCCHNQRVFTIQKVFFFRVLSISRPKDSQDYLPATLQTSVCNTQSVKSYNEWQGTTASSTHCGWYLSVCVCEGVGLCVCVCLCVCVLPLISNWASKGTLQIDRGRRKLKQAAVSLIFKSGVTYKLLLYLFIARREFFHVGLYIYLCSTVAMLTVTSRCPPTSFECGGELPVQLSLFKVNLTRTIIQNIYSTLSFFEVRNNKIYKKLDKGELFISIKSIGI